MGLDAGTRLGPYEIVAPIGAGGMGEVYRARDPRLGRDVAVKVLAESLVADPARLRRFEHEARAVAALSHPNVLAIFDVGLGGVPYLVTELLDGATLRAALERGPLPLPRVVEVARQLVAGLCAAHARGIVHRDLKPENIFVTTDGIVKILDFGLAKQEVGAGAPHAATIDATTPGVVLGTVGYMAPEQVRGEPADARADLFAVGAILYELASGRRAFHGDSAADTMSAVLREHPPDLALRTGTPPAIARIVGRCLEKRAADRFQSAAQLKAALDGLSDDRGAAAPRGRSEKSIAVLPFANMSADADNQYFSDGLAEELINALTRLPGLHVASRTSSFRFRGREADIREIGRELEVAAVLEGSVRRAGNRLRVTAQLTSVADGYHIWSERYDREMADVFAIQDEIVESIVKALAPTLAGEAKGAVRRPTENLEAYELYLKGRHYWHQRSPSNLQAAVRSFEQVIALDPDYALAYAGLADCYAIFRVYGWYPAEKSGPPAIAAVDRALALDPSLAEVHYSKALVVYYFDRHWRGAEQHMRRALAINPRLAMAQAYLGLVLASDYRFDEALSEVTQAQAIDPLSPFIHYLVATVTFAAGRFEATVAASHRVLELQPDALMGLWPLALAQSCLGRHDEAIAAAERAVTLSRAPFYVGILGGAYASAGRREDARRLHGELQERSARGEYVSPATSLPIEVTLGDLDGVRTALRACVADQTPPLTVQVLSGVRLDALRSDADIDRLLDRIYDGARPRG